MQAVILAGGEGRRLKAVTGDIPKPLAKIAGHELLDHQLRALRNNGINEVVLLVGYGAERIQSFVGTGERWSMAIRCVADGTPRGTAGALIAAREALKTEFLLVYGDTIFDIDIARMLDAHRRANVGATLLLHPNDHPHDSDLVEVDNSGRILAFHPYPHSADKDLPNLVNAGMYILARGLLDHVNDGLPSKPDFGKHLFPALLRRQVPLLGYRSPEYIKDAGTPERLRRVEQDLISGRVAGKSLRNPCPAIFLDRDGTLNQEINRVRRPEELILIPGTAAAVSRLNNSAYRTVIVTNQGVVARGECDEATLDAIHRRLDTQLGREAAYVDALYYCPHMYERGFPGERADLKIDCDCRKPKPGLIHRAVEDLNIDLTASWMVGDSTVDVMLAQRCGIRSVLLRTGHAGLDGKFPCMADFECRDLSSAVGLILDQWPLLAVETQAYALNIPKGATVLVGGQAHAGKSTWAGGLKLALAGHGHSAVVIPADSWLRGIDDRRGPTVIDRYDLDGLIDFLRNVRNRPGRQRIARYDRRTRRIVPNAVEIFVPADATIVVEGVPVLASAALQEMAQSRFFIERPESDRAAAFFSDYHARGWSSAEIQALWSKRKEEEFPLIETTKVQSRIISL